MSHLPLIIIPLASLLFSTAVWGAAPPAVPGDILRTLAPAHPRLMLTEENLHALQGRAESDETLRRFFREILHRADRRLDERALRYRENAKILGVSRACLDRVYDLGIAWRWTRERKYADKIEDNLLTVCGFPDWHPSHFLDAAEMSHAVAIGYDWIHDVLDEDTRAYIRAALIEKGLQPGVQRYRDGYHHFTYAYNWNQVCNGGLLIGALAIAESDPDTAAFVLEQALKHLPTALGSYAPDGVWAEGINYWKYATTYTAFALTALTTALGSDFGLSEAPGLAAAGYVPIYSAGPAGLYFSYADAQDFNRQGSAPCMFWLARTYGNHQFSDAEHALALADAVDPFHIIWYVPHSGEPAAERALDRLLRGEVDTALFRSAWNDPQAFFLGVKAGYNQAHHGHLDLGNFELDALGVRWARDLGADSYSLPDYWNYREGGKRWTYYRLNSFSHNVPLVGGINQDANANAKLTRFESRADAAFAQIELTEAYAAHAHRVQRGVAMIENRRTVLIQDEFDLREPSDITWGMTTDATVDIESTGFARLRLEGHALTARVLSPPGVDFHVESAEQPAPQKPNQGVQRLLLRLPNAPTNTRIAILLSPEWENGATIDSTPVVPLRDWSRTFQQATDCFKRSSTGTTGI